MVHISSAGRVVYPESGTTKGDVVSHFSAVGERLLFHLNDRPLTLERFPKGITGKGFMQKNAAKYFPDFIDRFVVERADGITTHPVVTAVTGIEYLANQNTITFHMPTTTATDYDHPDRVIIDLDPPPTPGGAIHEAAWATKALLDELGLTSIPVATGSKGFHVTAAVSRRVKVAEADEFGQLTAALLAARHPDLLTAQFRKANRDGRIFCDWLRNRWGATSVAPWSLRPRSKPTVAVPITWDQIDEVAPNQFELGNLPDVDPLRQLLVTPNDLSAALGLARQMAVAAGVQIEPFDRFRS
ncbi:MAG: ATP-dependent DNA ligase [bacterium]|nr:ATP-dependent DNA ligase [bacterium]